MVNSERTMYRLFCSNFGWIISGLKMLRNIENIMIFRKYHDIFDIYPLMCLNYILPSNM